MPDTTLQKYYDNAATVFSRSFRFVEWKFVIPIETGISKPFGDVEQPAHRAIKNIDRQKWIYVFRNDHEKLEYAPVREVILVNKNGDMAATPFAQIKRRGHPIPLGKTMCLPRRIFGVPQVYRFFASRIQLSGAQITELEKTITTFAPPVIFDPGENSSVIEQGSELLVPVIDPITIMLHLHAAFTAASEDVTKYTVPPEVPKTASDDERRAIASQRYVVERRRKKHLLATILKSIIDESDKDNRLVNQLKGSQSLLEDFLVHYDTQVQIRVERRDQLCIWLTQWHKSAAIKILDNAYKAAGVADWDKYIIAKCECITRLDESPIGRQYILSVLNDKDKKHFIHTYVWPDPDKELAPDVWQTIRKGHMTVLETFKTVAAVRILMIKGDYKVDTIKTLIRLLDHEVRDPPEPLTVKTIKKGAEDIRKVQATKVILPRGYGNYIPPPPGFKSTAHHVEEIAGRLQVVIEGINLCLAFKATMEAFEGDDIGVQVQAYLNLVGSGYDAASAYSSFKGYPAKLVARLSLFSAVIDVALGAVDAYKAFKKGDDDAFYGSLIVTAGATASTVSSLLLLFTTLPGGQIIGIIGLLVMGIGSLYKALTSTEPIENFFAHCTWGSRYLKDKEEPDWSLTNYMDWQGAKEFDHQLEALLNIVCDFQISKGSRPREARFKMGWLPPNARLRVIYSETWVDKNNDRVVQDEDIVFERNGPKPSTSDVKAGFNTYKYLNVSFDPTKPFKQEIKPKEWNPTLKTSEIFAQLTLQFEEATIKLPWRKADLKPGPPPLPTIPRAG